MFTKIVTATDTATDLKTLMEAGGSVFPSDNDSCTSLIIQLDPDSSETVDVMSEGETAGITLTNATTGPASASFDEFKIRNVYLLGSAASVSVKVLVSQKGA